ncbi:MAG: 6-bladed beta-propeller [Agriterribacter sp.]
MISKSVFFLLAILLSAVLFAQEEVRIDPEYAMGCKANRLFSEVEFIPLETIKESIFGNIDDLAISDRYIIVHDRSSTSSILIFSSTGKFLKKITEKKDIYHDINWMYYDKINDIIQYRVRNAPFDVLLYSIADKKTTRKEKFPKTLSWQYHQLPNSIVCETYRHAQLDTSHYELYVIKDSVLVTTFFPARKAIGPSDLFTSIFSPFCSTDNQDSIIYSRDYDYNIYSITSSGISSVLKFIFPANNSIPPGFETDTSLHNKRGIFFKDNTDKIVGVSRIVAHDSKIFFRLRYGVEMGREKNKDYAYDKSTGELFSIGHIEPDSISHQFPVSDFGDGVNLVNYGLTYHNGNLYTCISSLDCWKIYELLKASGKEITSPGLINFFRGKKSNMPNPVIVKLTIKTSG